MEPLIGIILIGSFLLGLAVGSFLAARVIRVAQKLPSHLWGRSMCLACSKPLAARDLVPMLSFLVLRGRCRQCRAPISPTYFWIELATGLLFVAAMALGLWTQLFPLPMDAATQSVFFLRAGLTLALLATMIFITALDLMIMAFPVTIIVAMVVLTLLISLVTGYPVPLLDATLGALSFALTLIIIRFVATKARGIEAMGTGDIYLAALIGVSLGLRGSIVAFYTAFILGALVSIVLLLKKRASKEAPILPFAPFLALGWFIATFFGSSVFLLLFPIL